MSYRTSAWAGSSLDARCPQAHSLGLLFLLWLTVFYFLAVVCILLSLSGAGTQKAEIKNCAKWCPINSKCVSNRSCVCKPGFSSEKELITNPAESCEGTKPQGWA